MIREGTQLLLPFSLRLYEQIFSSKPELHKEMEIFSSLNFQIEPGNHPKRKFVQEKRFRNYSVFTPPLFPRPPIPQNVRPPSSKIIKCGL